ncbi:MAG: SWIM zinc finger family protein [Chloroflexi bacterium]|nr:SWIM zinc finger family protein [Chloroflexota bacterium]
MPVTVDLIKRRTNDATYKRGLDIYREERLLDMALRGDELEAYYQGSGLKPYHIVVEMDGNSVKTASCTCGYKRNDDCKHIVALLTTYMMEPDAFEKRAAPHDPLLELGRDELIDLVNQMLVRYPDLQALVEEPRSEGYTPNIIDIEPYRRELNDLLKHEVRSRYAPDHIYSLAETAERFAEQGNHISASALLRMIIEETLEPDHFAFDEEGNLIHALSEVSNGLSDLLRHLNDNDEERMAIFDALLDAFIWEHNTRWENLTEHIPEIILAYARESDIESIRQRIEAQRKDHQQAGRLQAANTYATFLNTLNALDSDPAVILNHLDNQRLYTLLFYKLMQLEDVQEAISVARQHLTDPDDFLDAAATLTDYGYNALQMTENVLKTRYDDTIASWLVGQYRAADRYPDALRVQRQRMAQNPGLGNYLLLKELGGIMGQWQDIRPKIMQWLGEKKHYEVLTEIHLEEQDWEAAWKSLGNAGLSEWRYRELEFEVAQQSRFALPQKAIAVYMDRVRENIEAKKRENYQIAVDMLRAVRRMYEQLDKTDTWNATIAEIKEGYKRLSAFQDEIEKAGL